MFPEFPDDTIELVVTIVVRASCPPSLERIRASDGGAPHRRRVETASHDVSGAQSEGDERGAAGRAARCSGEQTSFITAAGPLAGCDELLLADFCG